MNDPASCPHCSEALGFPIASHGSAGQSMHSNRDCPNCGEPLVYYTEGDLRGRWLLDQGERTRQEHIADGEGAFIAVEKAADTAESLRNDRAYWLANVLLRDSHRRLWLKAYMSGTEASTNLKTPETHDEFVRREVARIARHHDFDYDKLSALEDSRLYPPTR